MEIEKLKEQLISDPEVRTMIARRAYEIFLERQGRYHAHPAEDWLRAESEILPRLIHEMVERNRRAILSPDDSDPVVREAAEHMQQELETARTEREPSAAAKTTGRALLKQNRDALAAQRDEAGEATLPDARAVLGERTPTKKAAAKKAPAKAAAKKAPAKKAAEKAPAKSASRKAPARKAAAEKAPAAEAPKRGASKRSAGPAERKAPKPERPE